MSDRVADQCRYAIMKLVAYGRRRVTGLGERPE
jgi:hypothetical protein